MERCDALGAISDEPGALTRMFLSPAMRRANKTVGEWMRAAGLTVREDGITNLIGTWRSENRNAKTLLLGSHLDTVRNAGKYDGPLGVLVALAAAEQLRGRGTELPFHLEVIAFADEEGARFQTTYLGSRALAGTLPAADLRRTDTTDISLRDSGIGDIKAARRKRGELLGYGEVHIEQGPVLEAERLALGVVSAISGQTRARLRFTGRAAHAGTTPMNLRKDALCAAAEFITAVENFAGRGLVGTVGSARVQPDISNVVPAEALLTLDVRHQTDAVRVDAARRLRKLAERIAARRKLSLTWSTLQETRTVECDDRLTKLMRTVVGKVQDRARMLPSGAGHDAAAMAAICPVTMLFVRCKKGISHHPDESVSEADVAKAIAALTEFILLLKAEHE
jgi:allantoate deiminase